jgi:carboxyl-terminal processing protease
LKASIVRRIGARLDAKALALDTDWRLWETHVETHRAAIDAAATQDDLADALDAALAEFGVSHLSVLTPRDITLRKRGLRGGLGLKTVAVDDGRLVTSVLPESAALAAGLRTGDVVISARNDLARASFESGIIGETVSIEWQRENDTFEADLVFGSARRAAAPTLRWIDEDIAWITVPSFSSAVYKSRAIDALFREVAGARALVVDVRSNGGGRLSNVEHLLGRVVEPGTRLFGEIFREQYDIFLRYVGREPASITELLRTTGQTVRSPRNVTNPYLGPLAIIADGRSGSGGDLVPATIQSLGRGVVVGTPTMGKVLIGDEKKLPGGYVLFYPRAEIVRIDGRRMEANPIQPDILLSPQETVDDETLGRVLRGHFSRLTSGLIERNTLRVCTSRTLSP